MVGKVRFGDFSWWWLRAAMSITQSPLATQPSGGWWVESMLQRQQKSGKWDGFLMSGQWEWTAVGNGFTIIVTLTFTFLLACSTLCEQYLLVEVPSPVYSCGTVILGSDVWVWFLAELNVSACVCVCVCESSAPLSE